MADFGLVLVGLFLPLFPFSIAFNAILERISTPLPRLALLLAWPFLAALDEAGGLPRMEVRQSDISRAVADESLQAFVVESVSSVETEP